MQRLSLIILLIIPFVGMGQNPDGFDKMLERRISDTVPYIQAERLHSILKQKDIILLDTRKRKEYEVSHIEGAIFISYDDFKLKQVKGVPKNKKIVLYCSIGYRSGQIGEKLLGAGFTSVTNLYGGIFNWVNNGYPVVNQEGNKVEKVHGYSYLWARWVNEQRAEAIVN